MGDTARKTARADTWRVPGSPDGASRADTVAQSGKSGKLGKLGTRRRSNGRLATGCLGGCVGACLMLLLGCVLLSVAYPAAAQAVSTSIKATLKSIGTQRPYQTDALPARITLWQGRLYAPGPFGSTSVYAPATGTQLATFSGDVVGSDEQLLYVGLGRVLMSVQHDGRAFAHSIARLPLTARDARGTPVWTYPTGAGDGGDRYDLTTWICQLQSSRDLVYVRLNSQIVALDKTTGGVRWSYRYESSGCSQAVQLVITQQVLYLLAWNRVIALSASDGYQLDYQHQHWQDPGPARQIIADADGQVVYVSDDVRDRDGLITAHRATTGAVLWQQVGPRPGPKYVVGVRDGVLYLLQDHPGQLAALSAATGHVLWSVTLVYDEPSQGAAFVGATQELLYLAVGAIGPSSYSRGPSYLAFDTHSGMLRWQQRVPEARSVALLAGQALYSAALLHRRQVTTGGFGGPRDVANCSDIASLHTLAAASGGVVWQRATSFSCTADDNYF